jgi:hypothetical protein
VIDSISVIGHALVYPIAVLIFAWLVSNKHVRNWACRNKYLKKEFEEVEATERLHSNAFKKHDVRQPFEIEEDNAYLAISLLGVVTFFGLGIFLLWGFLSKLISDLNSSSVPAFDKLAPTLEWIAIAVGLLALACWVLHMTLLTPTLLKVTHEGFFIKRLWPRSSPTIHLNEVRQIQLKWGPGAAEYGGGKKTVNKIIFILQNETKYVLPLYNFLPTSIEKLVQHLQNSSVSNKIVNVR